jgi:uncharacterized membrane protein YbhN (UPF0104 family)
LGARCAVSEGGKRALSAFLFLAALAFMGLAVARDWDALVSFPWQFRWLNVAGLALMHSLASGTLFLAWHLMMRRLAGSEDWRGDFQIYSLSILSRRIPTPIWYVGSRLYLYQKRRVTAATVLSATGLEAVLIGLCGIVCYVLLLPWYTYTQRWSWQFFLAGGAVLVTILAIRPNLPFDLVDVALRLLGRPALDVSLGRTDLALWALIYLATWFLDGIGLYCLVSALLPASPAIVDVVGVSTLSALVALATLVLPGGLGLKELTMGALLSAWIPMSAGVAISVLYRLLHTLLEALWAWIGYLISRRSARHPVGGDGRARK